MKKFLGFLVSLAVLFVLGSFFMPTRLQIKKQIAIANNKAIVFDKVQDINTFQNWLKEERQKNVQQKGELVYWEENGKRYSYNIEKRGQDQIFATIQELESQHNFTVSFSIKSNGERDTNLAIEIISEPSLAPISRYRYHFEKQEVIQLVERGLEYVKQASVGVHYERFHLSSPEVVVWSDTIFRLPRKNTIIALKQAKDIPVDSLLIDRLLRYRMLDTARSCYLQYTNWSDTVVQFNVCIPLVKLPTKKQGLWLRGGNVDFVKGTFYTATYKGAPQDLHLAWDSLYTKLSEQGKVAEGFPLEKLIQKTDSTETRKLFIRLR